MIQYKEMVNMKFSINTAPVKEAADNIDNISEQLIRLREDIDSVSKNISNNSRTFYMIAQRLNKEARYIENLISKFASMEDGLEKAVYYYLQCEQKLVGSGEEFNSKKKQSILDIIRDFISTGVWRDPEKADRIRRDQAMASELKALLKTKDYSKDTWSKASIEERKRILNNLFNDMQSIYGISLSEIVIEPIEAEPGYITYGYYRDSDKLICINESVLSNPNSYDSVMDTMVHEMRHGYQHAVVDNPNKFNVDLMTVEEWRNNFNRYKTINRDGFDAYRNQPIEVDARTFAGRVV